LDFEQFLFDDVGAGFGSFGDAGAFKGLDLGFLDLVGERLDLGGE